jgi:hypothetical protein
MSATALPIAPRLLSIHKRMRKPHFTPIHDAIPYTFYQRKDIVVLWIQDNLLERSLLNISMLFLSMSQEIHTSSACNRSISLCVVMVFATSFNVAPLSWASVRARAMTFAATFHSSNDRLKRERKKRGRKRGADHESDMRKRSEVSLLVE